MHKSTSSRFWRASAIVALGATAALGWAAFAPIRGFVSADPPLPEAYPTSNGDALRPMGDRLDVAGDTVLVWMAGAGERSLFGVDCGTGWLATAKSGLPTRYAPPPPGSIAEGMVDDMCRAAPLTALQRLRMRVGGLWPAAADADEVARSEARKGRREAIDRYLRTQPRAVGPAMMDSLMVDSLMVDSAMARDTLTRSARVE